MKNYTSIEWIDANKTLRLLDQSVLPAKVVYNDYTSAGDIATAIKNMVVRGAPLIGVTAAYGLVVESFRVKAADISELADLIEKADILLRATRPTAVNLFWALDEMKRLAPVSKFETQTQYKAGLLSAAQQLAEQDIQINKKIAQHAMQLMPKNAVTFIHHCNTGSLATVDYGTALGVIRMAHEQGLATTVFVDETRPRLQGAKLTSWELKQLGIKHYLIVDGASSSVMSNNKVDLCIVGCDRVAANGDVANKIGTCNLAIVAKAHKVPFFVAAPLSTIDLNTLCRSDIEIEQRDGDEVTNIDGAQIAPEGVLVYNPAFDVTPAEYISAIITEKGIVYPPFQENLQKLKEA
jgi:methylthioribose-1-phosphate isomerase